MAICVLNKNLTRTNSCGYSLPEIVDIYLINYEDISGTPVVTIDSGNCEEVTSIALKDGKEVWKVEPNKNSASFEDTLQIGNSGNKYRQASVTFGVSGTYDGCLHASLDGLSLGRFIVIIKTADGSYLMMGRISPLEAETVTLAGGSDNNGITVTLNGNIAESPMPLSDAAVNAILAKVHQDE